MDDLEATLERARRLMQTYDPGPAEASEPAWTPDRPTSGPFVALNERLQALRADLERAEREHQRVAGEMSRQLDDLKERTEEHARREAAIAKQFALFRQVLKEV